MTSAPRTLPAGLVVAIDGPSGSGKSTISRRVATALGLRYLDTGATYRAVTWLVLDRGVDPTDQAATAALAAETLGSEPGLQVGTDPAGPWVHIAGHDVTEAVRGPEVTRAVSAVSASPALRERLVAFQREVVGGGGIVVEGRDITTVVLPEADVKVFLTASDVARAARRAGETVPVAGGGSVVPGDGAPDHTAHVAATLADLARRDQLDSTRAASPLTKAGDAVELDSTDLGIDEVTDRVLGLCEAAAQREGERS